MFSSDPIRCKQLERLLKCVGSVVPLDPLPVDVFSQTVQYPADDGIR
jgi:hypothetical protein